jgi:uncharacterized protein
MTETLGIIIAITQLVGYYAYFVSIKNGVKPNTTSWTIWTFGNILELTSYMYLTGDWVKNLLPVACGLASILLYVHCLRAGKFRALKKEDYLLILADIVATGLWIWSSSPLVGNLAYQISTIISFIPIIREIYDEDENETPLPWLIWTVSYFLSIILVILRWEKWGDIVYPVLYFVLHGLTWILIMLFKNKNQNKNVLTPPSDLEYRYLPETIKDEYESEEYLYVARSKVAGKGLYTRKSHKKGEKVFVMKGPLLTFNPKNKEEATCFPNAVGIGEKMWIDPVSPYEFINHSCNPNVSCGEDAISYYALRDIESNEELSFDYSTSEFSDWEMNCACNSKTCRQEIKSIEYLPEEFYQRYYPYIPKYFQNIYTENKQKQKEKNGDII